MSLKKTKLFEYRGCINYALKQQLASSILGLESIKDKNASEKKRLRYLLDECLTNIDNYYKLHELHECEFGLKLYKTNHDLIFEFKNRIRVNDVKALFDNISLINKAKEYEINTLVVKTLKTKHEKNKMGAGLGLITLKQKMNCDISCRFLNYSAAFKIFKLIVRVNV